MKALPYLLLFLLILSCKQVPEIKETSFKVERKPVKPVVADSAMVVSARKEASKIGVEILKKGGNAFDAMIGRWRFYSLSNPIRRTRKY